MAKRRNAKKEKAIRNKLNARKFSKNSSRRSSKFKRYSRNNDGGAKSDNDSETTEATEQ